MVGLAGGDGERQAGDVGDGVRRAVVVHDVAGEHHQVKGVDRGAAAVVVDVCLDAAEGVGNPEAGGFVVVQALAGGEGDFDKLDRCRAIRVRQGDGLRGRGVLVADRQRFDGAVSRTSRRGDYGRRRCRGNGRILTPRRDGRAIHVHIGGMDIGRNPPRSNYVQDIAGRGK